MCVHVLCTELARVLAIRKTTSGKVHINHVPQLKERNGAEMSGGRKWRRRKNNETGSEVFRAARRHCLL